MSLSWLKQNLLGRTAWPGTQTAVHERSVLAPAAPSRRRVFAGLRLTTRNGAHALDVFVSPYAIEVSQRKERVLFTQSLSQDHDTQQDKFSIVLNGLREAFTQLATPQTSVRLRLSNHYVRYALVPGVRQLRAHAERLAAARHQLGMIYGTHAEDWSVSLSHGARQTQAVAAGVERSLIEQLAALFLDMNLRLDGIEPLLAAAFNTLRSEIGKTPSWFAVLEPQRLALAHLDRHDWQLLRVERMREETAAELQTTLERARISHGLSAGRVLLAAATPLSPDEMHDGWQFEWHPLHPCAVGAAT